MHKPKTFFVGSKVCMYRRLVYVEARYTLLHHSSVRPEHTDRGALLGFILVRPGSHSSTGITWSINRSYTQHTRVHCTSRTSKGCDILSTDEILFYCIHHLHQFVSLQSNILLVIINIRQDKRLNYPRVTYRII